MIITTSASEFVSNLPDPRSTDRGEDGERKWDGENVGEWQCEWRRSRGERGGSACERENGTF